MSKYIVDSNDMESVANKIRSKSGGTSELSFPTGWNNELDSIPIYDMSVENNQVKMVVDIFEDYKELWIYIAVLANKSVVIDWGDGNTQTFTRADNTDEDIDNTPKKHSYDNAGKYLVTMTGDFKIGSIASNTFCGLCLGDVSPAHAITNNQHMHNIYLSRMLELSIGSNVPFAVPSSPNLGYIRATILHTPIIRYRITQSYFVGSVVLDNSVTNIWAYAAAGAVCYLYKIPSTVTYINNNAFDDCRIRYIDFTDFELDENNEFPCSISSANVFRNAVAVKTSLVFKTPQIADVVKQSTNWSVYASKMTDKETLGWT